MSYLHKKMYMAGKSICVSTNLYIQRESFWQVLQVPEEKTF